MAECAPAPDVSALLAEQQAYYRARAGEYDEWWFRTGRYDRGADLNARWFADVAAVETGLVAFLDARKARDALELACGTGLFTRLLAPRVDHLLALDGSPEVIAINRARVAAANVEYVLQDLFAWQPTRRYDLIFMSFWLSHVPDERFDRFWSSVRAALARDGIAYLIDSGWDTTSTAANHVYPDRAQGIATRKLNDGREFHVVKVFHEPLRLEQRLESLGFAASISSTPHYFIHGTVRQAD